MGEATTSLPEYWDALKRADWYYDYSDDHSVWTRGYNEMGRLQRIAKESDAHQALYDGWLAHYVSEPKQGVPGRVVEPPARPEN